MKNSRLIIAVLLTVVCISSNLTIFGDDSLQPLHDKIKKEFLQRDSESVARKAHKGKFLSTEFQEFLDTDELALKMTQVYGDGTGEFAVKVINKKDAIAHDCAHKRHELNKENTASIQNETWSKVGMLAGTAAIIGGLVIEGSTGRGKKDSTGIGLAAGGVVLAAGSVAAWYYNHQKQERKQIHIAEVTKIEEKWNHNFAVLQKKHEEKHQS